MSPSRASPATRLVTQVHSRVRGRARFRVAGLYRSDALKRLLERKLVLVGSIRSAQADILTGHLLVIHDPRTCAADVAEQIQVLLPAGSARSRAAADSVAAQQRPAAAHISVGYAVSSALRALGALLRGFPPSFARWGPAFGPAAAAPPSARRT